MARALDDEVVTCSVRGADFSGKPPLTLGRPALRNLLFKMGRDGLGGGAQHGA